MPPTERRVSTEIYDIPFDKALLKETKKFVSRTFSPLTHTSCQFIVFLALKKLITRYSQIDWLMPLTSET